MVAFTNILLVKGNNEEEVVNMAATNTTTSAVTDCTFTAGAFFAIIGVTLGMTVGLYLSCFCLFCKCLYLFIYYIIIRVFMKQSLYLMVVICVYQLQRNQLYYF